MDNSKNSSASPTPVSKSEKKEPLSLEELLAKKKAEELARSKVSANLLAELLMLVFSLFFSACVFDKRTTSCRSPAKETRGKRISEKKARGGTQETLRVLAPSRWWTWQ